MKLLKVDKPKIYIKNNSSIFKIDVSENDLYRVVKENNFSSIELELFLREYNKGVEEILKEKVLPEYSDVDWTVVDGIIKDLEKDFSFMVNGLERDLSGVEL